MIRTTSIVVLAAAMFGGSVAAQANAVPGKDARLLDVYSLTQRGRSGSTIGFSAGVQICNNGTVDIDWRAPMDPLHPMYSFIICRETGERFQQITDHSYVKHGFLSINGNLCGSCGTSNGSILGPNCSDTYGSSLNSDPYYLGPPEEIDPWLGAWNPVGSHFDRGEPDVGSPGNMNGQRSLSRTQARNIAEPLHRLQVQESDLQKPNSRFFYGSYVVVTGEPENLRDNNGITRECQFVQSGNNWAVNNVTSVVEGTILQHWSGATITSATNGNADGRFFVGVKVSGPNAQGLWHYEYAIHNRDNGTGGVSFRIPRCPDSQIFSPFFKDVDLDPLNDWNVVITPSAIEFHAPAGNPQLWNTVFNFAFDSDAGPDSGTVSIDQASMPTGGNLAVDMTSTVPGVRQAVHLGDGCGSPAPVLDLAGSPPVPTIPNPTFGFSFSNLTPGAPTFLFYTGFPGTIQLNGSCTQFLTTQGLVTQGLVIGNGAGTGSLNLNIPNNPAIEGTVLAWQAAELVNSGGAYLNQINLTNGLLLRVGNNVTGCQ